MCRRCKCEKGKLLYRIPYSSSLLFIVSLDLHDHSACSFSTPIHLFLLFFVNFALVISATTPLKPLGLICMDNQRQRQERAQKPALGVSRKLDPVLLAAAKSTFVLPKSKHRGQARATRKEDAEAPLPLHRISSFRAPFEPASVSRAPTAQATAAPLGRSWRLECGRQEY